MTMLRKFHSNYHIFRHDLQPYVETRLQMLRVSKIEIICTIEQIVFRIIIAQKIDYNIRSSTTENVPRHFMEQSVLTNRLTVVLFLTVDYLYNVRATYNQGNSLVLHS